MTGAEAEDLEAELVETELDELRRYRRQMEAMWWMMQSVADSIREEIRDSPPRSFRPACMRLLGVIEASTVIMTSASDA